MDALTATSSNSSPTSASTSETEHLISPGRVDPRSRAANAAAGNPADDSSDASCNLTLRIAGMSCAACQAHVERALAAVPGVQEATVDLLAYAAHLQAAPGLDPQLLATAVRRAGYDVLPPATASSSASSADTSAEGVITTHVGDAGEPTLGLRALVALLAGALAMLLSMPLMTSSPGTASSSGGAAMGSTDLLSRTLMHLTLPLLPASLLSAPPQLLRWTMFVLALGTMLFAAPEIYLAAWRAARHRATNMNTLVALGTLVAFSASAYTTVALSVGRPSRNFTDVSFEAVVLILAFLLAGRWLEARARQRANQSLHALARQEAVPVRWVAEGDPDTMAALAHNPDTFLHTTETLLPLDAVAVGDLLRVLPGDRIPLDSIVLAGCSSVNESMLTGEPLPVPRQSGDKLFAGTLNLEGPLLLRATALGADSLQAQMARLLERARATRAPLQRLADRASAVFVPVVLALATLTFFGWAVADNTGPHPLGLGRALSFAVAVLVVACPCAMGLAVPAAVAVSLGTAARAGILIKGGETLERLAAVRSIVFDKTGTLTEGRPEIIAETLEPGAPFDRNQLLRWAHALESISTHPVALAVQRYTSGAGLSSSASAGSDLEILPGLGVKGIFEGHEIFLGRNAPGSAPSPPPGTVPTYATPLHLTVDGVPALSLYAVDTARPTAATAIAQLKGLGLATELLTGDTLPAAQQIAQTLGIAQVRARQLPADKLSAIADLRGKGQVVAMVGDGLNDAAALAHADVGIAVAAGTDLAREAGHVLLLQHDVTLVPVAVRLARRSRRLMQQNLGWAVVYNLLGVPLAAGLLLPHFGLVLSPALASAAMALSSTSVLLNSLRLARPLR